MRGKEVGREKGGMYEERERGRDGEREGGEGTETGKGVKWLSRERWKKII